MAPPINPVFDGQMREIFGLARAGRHAEADAALRTAAKAGNPEARYLLGKTLLVGEAVPRDLPQAQQWLTRAGASGHGRALHLLAVMAAAGMARAQDWSVAMNLLEKAAAAGFEPARAQLALLGPASAFDPAPWLSPPPATMQFETPRVGVIRDFLTPEICSWLIECARPRLKPSVIGDPKSGEYRASIGRTNTDAHLCLRDADVIIQLVRARIAAALGAPMTHQEAPNVLHYDPDQMFAPHFDFMDPKEPGYAGDLAANGQRAATFLVYLNDDFDGGETDFLDLGWRFKGRTGDALFFWNVSPEGEVERKLLHAGVATTRGEKWLLSQWVRDRPVFAI